MVVFPAEDVSVAGEAGDGGVEGGVAGDAAQAAGVPFPLHRQQVESVDDPLRAAGAEGGLVAAFPARGDARDPAAGRQARPWGADA